MLGEQTSDLSSTLVCPHLLKSVWACPEGSALGADGDPSPTPPPLQAGRPEAPKSSTSQPSSPPQPSSARGLQGPAGTSKPCWNSSCPALELAV